MQGVDADGRLRHAGVDEDDVQAGPASSIVIRRRAYAMLMKAFAAERHSRRLPDGQRRRRRRESAAAARQGLELVQPAAQWPERGTVATRLAK